MKIVSFFVIIGLLLAGCSTKPEQNRTAAPMGKVPAFDHIVVIWLENRSYNSAIGNKAMPFLNQLAGENVLLSQYYAVTHPSLPNYLALAGGDTFGITNDCTNCFLNQTSLADLLEKGQKTWKTYQEGMPSPCFVGNQGDYRQKHNPFIYFDPVRTNTERCKRSIVPLNQLDVDMVNDDLPDFAFIMPNICNSGHDCKPAVADAWLKEIVQKLQSSSVLGQNYMLFIGFDESSDDSSSCCGLGRKAGGRVAAVIISPLAKTPFEDTTPLSHYSLLKTILVSWSLPDLGFTANPATVPVTAPWK